MPDEDDKPCSQLAIIDRLIGRKSCQVYQSVERWFGQPLNNLRIGRVAPNTVLRGSPDHSNTVQSDGFISEENRLCLLIYPQIVYWVV